MENYQSKIKLEEESRGKGINYQICKNSLYTVTNTEKPHFYLNSGSNTLPDKTTHVNERQYEIKSALNDVFYKFPQKTKHFIENGSHHWNIFVSDLSISKIEKITCWVLQFGQDLPYVNEGRNKGYLKSLDITANGVTKKVQIPYYVDQSGIFHFSTGWVKQ